MRERGTTGRGHGAGPAGSHRKFLEEQRHRPLLAGNLEIKRDLKTKIKEHAVCRQK